MEDFIDEKWVDAISIRFNKTIAKNAKKLLKNVIEK